MSSKPCHKSQKNKNIKFYLKMSIKKKFTLFDQIVGQEKALNYLKEIVTRRSFSHAYIFYGPIGSGKKLTALSFIALLNCSKRGCGVCDSCKQIMNKSFSDLLMVEPKGNYILVDDIREIRNKLSLKSYSGKVRGVIIDEADLMTEEASNALLKTLEEPQLNTVFILITSRPNRILSTINSRCQAINFTSISRDEVEKQLLDKLEIEPQIAKFLSRLNNYNFYRAKEIVSDGKSLEIRDQILDILTKIYDSDDTQKIEFASKVMNIMDKMSTDEIDKQMTEKLNIWKNFALSPKHFSKVRGEIDEEKRRALKRKTLLRANWVMDIISSWYRDILLLKYELNNKLITNMDYYKNLIEIKEKIEIKKLINILSEIQYIRNLMDININLPLAMETLFLKLGG